MKKTARRFIYRRSSKYRNIMSNLRAVRMSKEGSGNRKSKRIAYRSILLNRLYTFSSFRLYRDLIRVQKRL